MARETRWATNGIVTSTPQQMPIIRNLLPSELQVPGVTILRTMVTCMIRYQGTSSFTQRTLRAGLYFGPTPTGDELHSSVVDQHDWLWYGIEVLNPIEISGSDWILETAPAGRLNNVTSKAKRRLTGSESSYWMVEEASSTPDVADSLAFLSRTLVLLP